MTLPAVAAVALAVFTLASAAQAVTGFGLALVAVPLLALVLDPVPAVVASTMVGTVLTGYATVRERRHVEGRLVARYTAAALLGMPAGLALLGGLDERALGTVITAGMLLVVVLLALDVRLPAGRGTQYGAGLLSGALLTSTGMNGPPVVLSLSALGLPPPRARGTLQAAFLAQDLVAAAAFAVLGHVDPAAAVAALAGALGVPGGWWLGDRVFRRLRPERFRAVVLGTLAVTGLVSLTSAVG
ncbi:sulfite exporter TauE/SafE family protein [Blastococcus sp. SYSU D00820]